MGAPTWSLSLALYAELGDADVFRVRLSGSAVLAEITGNFGALIERATAPKRGDVEEEVYPTIIGSDKSEPFWLPKDLTVAAGMMLPL